VLVEPGVDPFSWWHTEKMGIRFPGGTYSAVTLVLVAARSALAQAVGVVMKNGSKGKP